MKSSSHAFLSLLLYLGVKNKTNPAEYVEYLYKNIADSEIGQFLLPYVNSVSESEETNIRTIHKILANAQLSVERNFEHYSVK
jgi:hypothetical protein